MSNKTTIDRSLESRTALVDCAPLLIAVIPFGAVFGAIARKEGLTLLEIMFASATIFAGAAQYAMLELWGQNVPASLIILTVFAINFRHVLYSAAIGRRFSLFSPIQKFLGFLLLVDMTYAAAEARARTNPITPTYFFVYGILVYSTWMFSNFLGALSGPLIPDPSVFALDFILPLYFVVLVLAFRTSDNFLSIVITSAIASILIYLWIGSPWHITLGAFAGLALAALRGKGKKDV